ncbi:MAG: RcnB family protein [Pseudomonadota bacterium]
MKSTATVCAAALAALSFGSLSFAQDFDRRGRGAEPPRFEQRGPVHRDMHDSRDFHSRQFDRRDMRHERRFETRGPQFHRGDRLPPQYRSQRGLNDWQARQLHAPAHGQQWVQVDADYALIAIATGVIAHLVLNR